MRAHGSPSSARDGKLGVERLISFSFFIRYPSHYTPKPIPMPAMTKGGIATPAFGGLAMTNLPLSLARDGFAISARLPSSPRVYLSQPSTSAGEEIGADEDEDYSTHLRYDSLIPLQFLPSAHGYRSHE